MDEDTLMGVFFEWLEEHEAEFELSIIFDSARYGIINFMVDSNHFTLDTQAMKVTTTSKNSLATETIEAVETDEDETSGWIELLELVVSKYQELKDFNESDEDNEEVELDAVDSIIQNPALSAGAIDRHIANHFVFREAQEAAEMLKEFIRQNPSLRYSCDITNRSAICNVCLDIDLAFLDISESSMLVLGLNYDHPLTISITPDQNMLLQSLEIQEWTSYLLGAMKFEVHQGGVVESYACKHYVHGRIQKFKEDLNLYLKYKKQMPQLRDLSRENSAEPTQSTMADSVTTGVTEQLVELGFHPQLALEASQRFAVLEEAMDWIQQQLTEEQVAYEEFQSNLSGTNLFYNLLFYLKNRLQNCTNYCFICYKRHPSESMRLRPCSKDICSFRFEEVSGVSICGELKNNHDAIALDLSLAAEALFSHRATTVFEPFPSFLLKEQQERGRSGFLERSNPNYDKSMDANKDMDTLREIFLTIPPTIQILQEFGDDSILHATLSDANPEKGLIALKLLKYVIATNRLLLHKLEGDERIKGLFANEKQFIVTNHAPETEHRFNQLKAQHGSFFAFHGSALENWYSILRNGIRNLSNTHMMTAGAAQGAGVYTAESMSTSLGYSRYTNTPSQWGGSILENHACMAIVEIINNNPEYKNGVGTYVVRNDSDLIIRYLLLIKNNRGSTVNANGLGLEAHMNTFQQNFFERINAFKNARIENAIKKAQAREAENRKIEMKLQAKVEEETKDAALDQKLEGMAESFSGQGSAVASKRILQEYKYLLKSKECKGLTVEFENESNIYVWVAKLDTETFEIPRELKNDFAEYSQRFNRPKELVFELRFDANFPFNPPFLRVLRPRFQFRTGHITIGGSICMQSLTPSGWIPVRTIESIFVEILFNLGEGGARLDLRSGSIDYSLGEAKEAFQRVARQHGWA